MNKEFFSQHLEVVSSSPERRRPPTRSKSEAESSVQCRMPVKRQGSIRRLLFGRTKSNGAESSSSNSKKSASFDSSEHSSKLTKRRKSLRLTRSAEELSKSRKTIARQKTFDASTSMEAPRRIRDSTGTSLTRQKSCSRLPSRRQLLVRSASEKFRPSTRKLIKTVEFGDVRTATFDVGSVDVSASWYCKKELSVLLDHEIHMTARSQGTTHNLNCCDRGIEQQLARENKTAKIATYVRTILKAEAEIRKKSAAIDSTEELLMISQILTKEDRSKAYKLGFKDASEVQMMNDGQLQVDWALKEESNVIVPAPPQLPRLTRLSDIKPVVSKSA